MIGCVSTHARAESWPVNFSPLDSSSSRQPWSTERRAEKGLNKAQIVAPETMLNEAVPSGFHLSNWDRCVGTDRAACACFTASFAPDMLILMNHEPEIHAVTVLSADCASVFYLWAWKIPCSSTDGALNGP